MKKINLLGGYPNPKNKRYVNERLRTIKHRIVASYRGKEFYDINCYVCHGSDGRGQGPVGLLFAEKAPVDLNDAYTQDQTDGQLYFTLTRGRALMPFYRDALIPSERWDVINYVRSDFGQVGMVTNE